MKLTGIKFIYMLGIGGIGMSALARYFKHKGVNVFGYDKVHSDLCKELELEGFKICYKSDVGDMLGRIKDIPSDQLLIIYTPAISSINLELEFFKKNNYNVYKRAEILGEISKTCFTIAIAGTHGKTTTTAILSHILKELGMPIVAFLGGVSKNYNTNLLYDKNSDLFVIEADEYDRSFLHLHPNIVIITSIDIDHIDTYKNKKDLENTFIQFVSQIKEKGLAIIEESIPVSFSSVNHVKLLNYSASKKADFYADNISVQNSRVYFDLIYNDKIKQSIQYILPGEHNIANVVAAVAVSSSLGLEIDKVADSIVNFLGIKRRFDILINKKQLTYIDDYAHHPKEVTCTIEAVKQLFPERYITVVFQPHLFSRTQHLALEFAKSLSLADQLILLDIYAARESSIAGVSSNMLLDLCTNSKKETCRKQDLLELLNKEKIDVLLTLGAGDIGNLTEPIKYMLN